MLRRQRKELIQLDPLIARVAPHHVARDHGE
jgi:hypothetical protein